MMKEESYLKKETNKNKIAVIQYPIADGNNCYIIKQEF